MLSARALSSAVALVPPRAPPALSSRPPGTLTATTQHLSTARHRLERWATMSRRWRFEACKAPAGPGPRPLLAPSAALRAPVSRLRFAGLLWTPLTPAFSRPLTGVRRGESCSGFDVEPLGNKGFLSHPTGMLNVCS